MASRIFLNAPFTGGASLTVLGLSFGDFDYTATSMVGSPTCATSSWTSSTSVMCMAAAGSDDPSSAEVTVASVVGTILSSFTFDGEYTVSRHTARLHFGD